MATFYHFFVVLSLYAAMVYAWIGWPQGCSPSQTTAIDNAVDEVITIATAAVSALANYNHDSKNPIFVYAALLPLFTPGDIPQLINLYTSLTLIRVGGPRIVSFYCTDDHLTYRYTSQNWADLDFYYFNANNERIRPMVALHEWTDPNVKPSSVGSFTVLGYSPNTGVDLSNQAHTYIKSTLWTPNYLYDQRPFATIKSEGLEGLYDYLDALWPLSETIFHELCHVVGGLVAPNRGDQVITDGPNGGINTFVDCVPLNFEATLGNPITTAACITKLAIALYLQIDNPNNYPTNWITGAVNAEILEPIYIPGDPNFLEISK